MSKAYFSKAYADGLSNDDELLEANCHYVDGTTISRDEYQINYNISDQYHEIVFEIKNYFGINNYIFIKSNSIYHEKITLN